jgi:hypothetical protein
MTSESQILVDALPYIDSGYDEPGVKQAVIIFRIVLNFLQSLFIFIIKKGFSIS